MAEPSPVAPRSWRKLARDPLVLGMVGLWLAHTVLMAVTPGDALSAYRNDTWWPGHPYMTVTQPGLILQLFAHVLVTVIGGMALAFLVLLLAGFVATAGGPDVRNRVPAVVMFGVMIYGFLFLRGVPARVTVLDRAHHTLTTRSFGRFTFWPGPERVIRGEQVVAIVTHASRYASWRRESDLVLRVYVLTADDQRQLIGLRPCHAEAPACVEAGDRDVAAIFDGLGLPAPAITPSASGDSRAYLVPRGTR